MGTDICNLFTPGLTKYVETLMKETRIGICSGTLRILDVASSAPTVTKQPCGDRFKLIIPYAGQSITWEVLLNGQNSEDPPDFIFGPDDSGFLPEMKNLQNLVNWNPKNPKALLLAVEDLVQEYRLYQHRLIDQNSRLQFEYTSLVDQGRFCAKDIEVHVAKKSEWYLQYVATPSAKKKWPHTAGDLLPQTRIGPVNFLLRLPVDFSRIPPYLTKDNPGEDSAVLLVTFQSADGAKVSPQLYLSPRVEHALGGSAGLRIPNFPSGGCLIDYVPNVCELLRNKVDQVVQGYERKRDYIAAFLSHYGRSVVEYDTEGFSRISFLMEWHDFFFMLTIDVPIIFPVDQPIFTFQSVYHEFQGKPYSKTVKEYPYSPRWSGNEMAERARAFILEYIPAFQRASVMGGSL